MICARCDFAILPGEAYTPVDKFSDSGAGMPMHLHESSPASSAEARRRILTHERRSARSQADGCSEPAVPQSAPHLRLTRRDLRTVLADERSDAASDQMPGPMSEGLGR